MRFQDAPGIASSAAPAMTSVHQHSWIKSPCRGVRRGERLIKMWERPQRRDRRDTKVPPTLTEAPLFLVRLNVLIHSKEIIGIVFLFDRDKPLVIVSVSLFHAFFAFVTHQKVYVRATGGVGMNRIVVTLRP